ncbi:MAG: Ig-like domain-containing protein [Paludibacteraceae bacterium]|nr:Ig-like domain-containing protein [Paludibacteraceae bacterium]
MKKYLIVLAAVVLGLASCKKQGGSKYTRIYFKNAEIALAEGASDKLQVLYEPTDLEAPVCEWATSNKDVVTVDQNGNIQGVALGSANVTAKLGELEAVCKVTVKSFLSFYQIEDYGVFSGDAQGNPLEWVDGTDTTFTLSWAKNGAGATYNCRLAYWPVLAWDGDLTYISGEGFAGAGFLLYSEVPFYTVDDQTAGSDNGSPFGWGSFKFAKTDGKISRNIGEAGAVDKDKYCEYIDSYVAELISGGDGSNIKWSLFSEAISGAMIFLADYTVEEPVWYYSDYGLVHGLVKDMNLIWDGDAEAFSYVADIDWFDFLSDDTYYGVVLGADSTVKKPYELRMISEHYEYGEAPAAAPALTEPMKVKRYAEMPILPNKSRKIATNKMYKK